MKHLLNNNKKHTTVKGKQIMAMKPKKKTSPKVVPIIPPLVAAVAGVAGRAAARNGQHPCPGQRLSGPRGTARYCRGRRR